MNSAVFVTAVTSSLERLKASLRTIFPSELVLDPIPDNHVDQHLAAMLTAHNQQATHTSGCNSSILPPPSSTFNTLNSDGGDVDDDYDTGLKDAVKVRSSHPLQHMHCGCCAYAVRTIAYITLNLFYIFHIQYKHSTMFILYSV